MWEFFVKYWAEALFGLVLAGLSYAYRKVVVRVKRKDEAQGVLIVGMKAMLHDRIMQAYHYFYQEQGYCSIYDMENVEGMYQAYRALHGNGIMEEMMERIRDLPTEP
ncbi:hypothetical protein LJC20_02655 [Eubacteriales bacterium OttesenSCG-928-M02]|nr:hypothetical protein [Eubacteriales bacterium OttesenSCG-928-M02]